MSEPERNLPGHSKASRLTNTPPGPQQWRWMLFGEGSPQPSRLAATYPVSQLQPMSADRAELPAGMGKPQLVELLRSHLLRHRLDSQRAVRPVQPLGRDAHGRDPRVKARPGAQREAPVLEPGTGAGTGPTAAGGAGPALRPRPLMRPRPRPSPPRWWRHPAAHTRKHTVIDPYKRQFPFKDLLMPFSIQIPSIPAPPALEAK